MALSSEYPYGSSPILNSVATNGIFQLNARHWFLRLAWQRLPLPIYRSYLFTGAGSLDCDSKTIQESLNGSDFSLLYLQLVKRRNEEYQYLTALPDFHMDGGKGVETSSFQNQGRDASAELLLPIFADSVSLRK